MLTVKGTHDEATVEQMWRCLSVGTAVKGVLCADGHLGYAQPVGGVVAYTDHVSVSGVGYDIACGNMAVKTDFVEKELRGRWEGLAKEISGAVKAGLGEEFSASRNDVRGRAGELFDDVGRWKDAGADHLRDKAWRQVGTIGSGNHYVDLLVADSDGSVWVGVHFGSRKLGHELATKFMKLAGGKDGMNVPPALLDVGTGACDEYLRAMELAGEYAYSGRELVVSKVLRILGARVLDSVHNHHNFAWRERHGDADLWVVRKGATPAFPGQRGFVGGSMGDRALIVRGLDTQESVDQLRSTIHGAGRVYGRAAAKRTFTRSEMDAWVAREGVHLVGGDVDESPMAYRRLDEVIAHHGDTVAIEEKLKPVVVVMAGSKSKERPDD